MKNFEFLKDFDSDMYALLSEFEREAVKNPKITEIELVEEITNIIEIDINTTKQTQTTNKQLTRK